MAQGYLLQEQLRQSQLAGEPIKEWGKFGEDVIKSVVGYHKGKLLTDIEARRAEKEKYEKAMRDTLIEARQEEERKYRREMADRPRKEKIDEFMDAARTGKYITFEKGDRVTYDIDSIERAEDLARKLGIRQDERVKPYFSGEYRYVPPSKYKYNPTYFAPGPVSEKMPPAYSYPPIMGRKTGEGTEINIPARPLIRGGFIKVGTPAKKSPAPKKKGSGFSR